ncbi:ribosome maturation factor RimP [Spiroplasma chinense]|uniref:Ribosome maturation factor RimP n=1 Tax=Spiroplasma chinense TaxID=216932 RepID=A0A5B9Y7I6_9MOLU|nr:hypothetical protein [Spiroplasma chinense]QEH62062.1 ribosome maturation factor RimP [Spiroplasma chinense]
MIKELVENKYMAKIKEILEENELSLYELNWVFEHESNVLQILAENKDATKKFIEFDALIAANEAISSLLDEDESIVEPYILEVSSAGAERAVKDQKTLENNIGSYFYIKSNIAFEGVNEFNATLNDYNKETNTFLFNFFLKGKPKKANLKFEDISFIRFAVKF